MDFDLLQACLSTSLEVTGTANLLPTTEIRIRSEIVATRKANAADGHDFLNSFIADDLERIADRADRQPVGRLLQEYLRPERELRLSDRIDVRSELSPMLAATAPASVPLGRWPEKVDRPLALGQQLAVSEALARGDTNLVIGVNGPPGTGKTTMLRDLIAGLVVIAPRS